MADDEQHNKEKIRREEMDENGRREEMHAQQRSRTRDWRRKP